jgi:hypothetical protein
MKLRPGLPLLVLASMLLLPVAAQGAVVSPLPKALTFGPSDSASPKSLSTSCPAGKVVTGAGGDVSTGNGEVVFDDLTPSADLKSVTVKGVEDQNGLAGNWAAAVQPICAYPLGGMQRVAATSPLDSSNKSVTVTCPAGKKVVGMGSDINAGNGQVGVDDFRPSTDLTSVTVQALEDQDGQAGPWNVTVYAICANPPSGLERVSGTSGLNSDGFKSANATCSAGKRLLGIGSDINAGSGQVQQTSLISTNAGLGALVLADEDEDGQSGPWSVTAFGICADEAHLQTASSTRNSTSPKLTGLACNEGSMSGQGADITGGLGQVGINDVLVGGPGSTLILDGVEDQTGTPNSWSQTAYAICGPPLQSLNWFNQASPTGSPSATTSTSPCPPGLKVVGGGGAIAEVSESGEVFVNSWFPSNDLTSMTAVGYEDPDGFSGPWAIQANAVCAVPPPGLQVVRVQSEPTTDEIADVTASCPPGKYLTGLAGGLQSAGGNGVIDDIRPDAALSKVSVKGIIGENGIDHEWTVDAYAICANI